MNEIESTLRIYYDAFHNCQWAEFAECLDDGFHYYTDGCVDQPKAEFVEFMSNNMESKGYTLSEVETIPSSDGSLVVARYTITFNCVFDGKPATVRANETTVFGNSSGVWKIMHSHSSNVV